MENEEFVRLVVNHEKLIQEVHRMSNLMERRDTQFEKQVKEVHDRVGRVENRVIGREGLESSAAVLSSKVTRLEQAVYGLIGAVILEIIALIVMLVIGK